MKPDIERMFDNALFSIDENENENELVGVTDALLRIEKAILKLAEAIREKS